MFKENYTRDEKIAYCISTPRQQSFMVSPVTCKRGKYEETRGWSELSGSKIWLLRMRELRDEVGNRTDQGPRWSRDAMTFFCCTRAWKVPACEDGGGGGGCMRPFMARGGGGGGTCCPGSPFSSSDDPIRKLSSNPCAADPQPSE